MKKLFSLLIVSIIAFGFSANAQDNDRSVKQSVKTGAKKVGNKSAEVASKSKAKVTDEKYKDKVGPNNQTIYIDNHSRYYWVDKKGKRHYVNASQLKARTK